MTKDQKPDGWAVQCGASFDSDGEGRPVLYVSIEDAKKRSGTVLLCPDDTYRIRPVKLVFLDEDNDKKTLEGE